MNKKAYLFLSTSFLQPLLENPEVTDIAFNGDAIFYQHNQLGRLKSEIIITKEAAFDFIRQLANLTEQLFSYSSPILDVSIERFRINAVHPAIGRKHFERATTFSVRVGHIGITAIEEDPLFMPPEVNQLFLAILKLHASIVIAGKTGTGKTELQKYLLQRMEPNARIVVIDNVLELEGVSSNALLDISLWQMSDQVNEASFSDLIRNALRSNPDWLIVAESRGKEMLDILNSAMTGHPVITTLHSQDVYSVPSRMTRMALMNDEHLRYDEVFHDVVIHFPFIVFLEKGKEKNLKIVRRIKAIAEVSNEEKNNIHVVFENMNGKLYFHPLLNGTVALLRQSGCDLTKIQVFAQGVVSDEHNPL